VPTQDLPAMTMQPFVPHHDSVKTAEIQDVLHNSFNYIIHIEREGRETRVNEIGGKKCHQDKNRQCTDEGERVGVKGKKREIDISKSEQNNESTTTAGRGIIMQEGESVCS